MPVTPLKALLRKRGIPVAELARHLNVDPSTVSHKLSGNRGWDAEEAVAVMQFLRERGARPSYEHLFGRAA